MIGQLLSWDKQYPYQWVVGEGGAQALGESEVQPHRTLSGARRKRLRGLLRRTKSNNDNDNDKDKEIGREKGKELGVRRGRSKRQRKRKRK
jgi:hypothetical protein